MSDFVLIHGTTQSPRGWDRLVRALDALGHRGVLVDLAGDDDRSATQYARDIAHQIAGDVTSPVVVAHSGAGLLLPAAAELQQGPVKRAALLARQAGWPVCSWRINVPSFSVYRGAVTPSTATPRPGDVILTRSDALDGLPSPVRVLYREGGVLLVRVEG